MRGRATKVPAFDPFTCPLDGAHFVEASAGTGKTFSLSWVVTRLVLEREAPIDSILVVTFTNAATAELSAAVRARLRTAIEALEGGRRDGPPGQRRYLDSLPEPRRAAALARAALADIDRATISSIHGFCQRTLGERAFESGVPFDASVAEDEAAFAARAADDFWARETYEAPPSRLEELEGAGWDVGRARAIAGILARDPEVALVPSADPVARDADGRAAAFVREAFAARRASSSALSFNDLLFELDRALADGERGERLAAALRERYRAALVDEFQDTNAVQYRIFRRVFRGAGAPFFAFGDPKQAIYRFRGGDVFAYLGAAAEPGARRWSLDVNHRSDEGLVRAVNALFDVDDPFRCGGRIGLLPVSVRPQVRGRRSLTERGRPRPPFEILRADPDAVRSGDIAPAIAADVDALLASDVRFERFADGTPEPEAVQVTPGAIAVLTRSNAQAGEVADALRRRGIQASTASDASVFATDEARCLAQLLVGVRDPAEPSAVATALCTPLFQVPAAGIRGIARGEGEFARWSRRMAELSLAFAEGGPVALVAELLALRAGEGGEPIAAGLFSRAGGAALASRLRHVAELAQTRGRAAADGVGELAGWLAARRRGDGPAEEGAQLRPETDGDAVAVMTVHKAKGLEFPVVYVPFASRAPLWRRSDRPIEYHDPARGDAAFVDLGSADAAAHLALSRAEEEAEETRLLYVALTRGKHLVKLVWWPPGSHNRSGPADALLCEHGAPGEVAGALSEASGGAFRFADLPPRPAAGIGERPRAGGGRIVRPPHVALALPGGKGSFSAVVEGREPAERPAGDDREAPGPAGAEVPLADFPAGADPGSLVHGVLSSIDFCAADRGPLDRAAAAAVARYGIGHGWAAPLADALLGALDAPLDAGGTIRLRGIPRERRLDELRFSVAAPRGGGPFRATLGDVADAIGAAAGDPWAAACAARARGLAPDELRSRVSGAVDLVFRQGDAFYVADYKTNRLGRRFEDYALPGLEAEMLERHYYLQYHLYALAVHRYLSARVAGYSYSARFGGVFYLFLRGMCPGRGPGDGVFFARPGEESIRALDALFGGGRRP